MKASKMKILPIVLVVLATTGCANRTTLYQWGGYEDLLFQSYKNPDKAADFLSGLETHIVKMEQSQQRVAPGLYAELGTLYLQAGDSIKAVALYTKEKSAWPESAGLMNSLIENIGKRNTSKTEVKS